MSAPTDRPTLTGWARRGRVALKRFLYSQMAFRDAFLIMLGRHKPLVNFTVEADPPSIYLNFAVRPDRLDDFRRHLDLPMPLSPIACLEGDEPFHAVTLNVYRVSGLVNGIRAEWSTFVADEQGVPRYMVIEAACENGTLDSVELFTPPGLATYVRDGDTYRIELGAAAGHVSVTVPVPDDEAPVVRADPAWVTANDFIFWRNGVCDRTFYDVGMANPTMRGVDPQDAKVLDASEWADFLEPTPRSVVVYEEAITFAISPWWNLDRR